MGSIVNLTMDDGIITRALTEDGIPVPSIPNGMNTFSFRVKFSNGNRAAIVIQRGFEPMEGEENPNGMTMFWVESDGLPDDRAYAMIEVLCRAFIEGLGSAEKAPIQ